MKKLVTAAIVLTATLLLTSNAFAFTWFFGTDSSVDYTASYLSSEIVAWLPITIEGDNQYMAGAHAPASVLLLDGVPGDLTTYDFNANLTQAWGLYGDAYLENAFSIQRYRSAGLTSLPDGVYTGDVSSTGLRLGVYDGSTQGSGAYRWLTPENNFHVTVGEQTNAVPEPATMLLFGSGLVGALIKRRRKA